MFYPAVTVTGIQGDLNAATFKNITIHFVHLENAQQDSLAPASQEPNTTKLPDLYAIRDKIVDDWEFTSKKESRRRYYEFADKFIEAIIAADSNYTMLQRLLSDLQQERKNVQAYGQAIANISTEYDTAKKH
jgi:hypothetical protein